MKNIKYILEYLKDQVMKIVNKLGKDKTLIIVGAIIFLFGFLLYQTRPKVVYQETGELAPTVLDDDGAKSLIDSIIPNILNVYEDPSKLFEVETPSTEEEEEESEEKEEKKDDKKEEETEEEIDGLKINNYDTVMPKYFTKDGINEFQKMMFSDKAYYKKVDDTVYFMNDVVPKTNKFTGDTYTITKLVIKDDEISCKVNFSRLLINELDEVSYEVYTKKLVLVKVENEDEKSKDKSDIWLVNSFDYANKV